MLCSLKSGRVVIILQGRFAGRKAVVVQSHDDGHGDRRFGHALGAYSTSWCMRRLSLLLCSWCAARPAAFVSSFMHGACNAFASVVRGACEQRVSRRCGAMVC
jgi:hypothetical protein